MPQDGTLRAALRGGGMAEARGERAKRLHEGLSAPVRERLRRRKSVRLRVTWSWVGRVRRIDRLTEG